jgi:hypothetical protein
MALYDFSIIIRLNSRIETLQILLLAVLILQLLFTWWEIGGEILCAFYLLLFRFTRLLLLLRDFLHG